MPHVELNEQLFRTAQRRASDTGFGTVEDYIADMVMHDVGDGDIDVTRLFTADRLAQIDEALAQARAGHVLTAEQSAAELARLRAEWIKVNGQ